MRAALERNYILERRPTEKIRRLSVTLSLANKRLENDRKRILGEQLNDAPKTGDLREAHRLSRILAGRRRRHLSRLPAKRQGHEGRAQTSEQLVDQGGCGGLRIIFSDEVRKMKRKLRTYCCGPKCDATGSQRLEMPTSRSMELRHWRASVPWSIPAELLKILVFPSGGANKPHKHGIGHKASREGSQHTPSPITKCYIFSLFAVVRAAEYAPIAWHRAQGAFIPYGATAERCIMVVCPLGRSRYRGPWDKKRVKETRNQTWSKPRHP